MRDRVLILTAASLLLPAAQAVGQPLRQLESKHLLLFTDLEPAAEIDELPLVFEQAIPQWCEFFQIDQQRTAQWRMTACVMQNPDRFRAADLLPDDLPPFLHGFQRGRQMWVNEQPSAYYRRHLLLHEGTHAFMSEFLGGTGPPWFMEGLAEYLGTHRWHEGELQLAYVPRDNEEVPHWGRVKIIKDDVAAGRQLSIIEVMQYGPRAHLEVEPYAWCWAAVLLLDQHPAFRPALHEALQDVDDATPELLAKLRKRIGSRWTELDLNWQVLLAHMDYGYDVRAAAVVTSPIVTSSTSQPRQPILVDAAKGWQSTGIELEQGRTYDFKASGRYVIAVRDKLWWCEPGGITIHYYHGRPLGQLLAAVVPDDEPEAIRNAIPIGVDGAITPVKTGTLFLCVNENPAALEDNEGTIEVTWSP